MFLRFCARSIFFLSLLLFFLAGCDEDVNLPIPSNGTPVVEGGKTIHVSTTGDDISGDGVNTPYRTLEKGIDAASSGDIVQVAEGTYRIVLRPSIILKAGVKLDGGGKATIDGENMVGLAVAGANGSTITGFTIKRATTGISCFGSNVIITGNVLETANGIDCDGGSAATISGNTITGGGGNGITVRQSANPTITGNTIQRKKIGIMCQENAFPRMDGNVITGNTEEGIRIEGSANADLGGGAKGSPGNNTLGGNGSFDLLNQTTNVIMAKNNKWDHTGQAIDDSDIFDDEEGARANPRLNVGQVIFQ